MGIRISEMEEAASFGEEDLIPIVKNGSNKKALGSKIKDFIAGFFVAKDDNSRLITSLGTVFTDCNAVFDAGMYYNSSMANVSNAPAGTTSANNAAQLVVTKRANVSRVFQTLYVYIAAGSGNKMNIYTRAQKNATEFADWVCLCNADGSNIDAAAFRSAIGVGDLELIETYNNDSSSSFTASSDYRGQTSVYLLVGAFPYSATGRRICLSLFNMVGNTTTVNFINLGNTTISNATFDTSTGKITFTFSNSNIHVSIYRLR